MAALAMCEATYQECDVLPQIKWPNDVIIDGKKICGILTEMSSEVQYVRYAVMGIGINANKEKFDETELSLQRLLQMRLVVITDDICRTEIYLRLWKSMMNCLPIKTKK